MATMKKVFHSDPSHGWLAVKLDELKMLGITQDISNFSYVKGKTAYLEEDCDAPKWLQHLYGEKWEEESKNIKVFITESHIASDFNVKGVK